MRVIWLICVIFVQKSVDVGCQNDEFVTIWAPKQVHEKREYNVIALPSNIESQTLMSLQFRKSYGTISLASEKLQKISMSNKKASGSKKEFNLTMTLYRKTTTNSNPQCMTKVLQSLEVVKQHFYIFIQLNKPIYKPSDKVHFRIIVVDKELKPFHFNNILVQFYDPFNRTIQEFNDPGEMFVGVFNSSFTLTPVTPLGEWTTRVIVDKKPQYSKAKHFQVQKYVLPPFETNIKVRDNHIVVNAALRLKIFGKYSFGDYVFGNVELIIKGIGNDTNLYYSKTYMNNLGVLDINLKVKDDLKVSTSTKVPLNITATITEPESGITSTKSIPLTVHAKLDIVLTPIHPEKFMPGMPFGVKVFVTKWNGEKILKTEEKVNIELLYQLENQNTGSVQTDLKLENGVAIHNFLVSQNAVEIKLKIKFGLVKYEKDIKVGDVKIGVNKITVEHGAINPNYKDKVKIHVRGTFEMDILIVLVMSRFGNIESHSVKCDYQILCNFDIKITKDMMPESKVVVYSVVDEKTMLHGETVIKTQELGANTLNIELPPTATTKTNFDMTITTKTNSKVFLLAFDKRLTYLAKGNEVTRNDVITEMADYDGTNKVTVFDMNEWHDCTEEEVKRVDKGRQLTTVHGGETFTMNEEEDSSNDDFEIDAEDEEPEVTESETDDEVRDFFPETWLYEDFTVNSSITNKTFKTTDSITSWMIYGFSVHKDFGLAVAHPKELIVKNQFFMKLSLPYSIRYNETLRLDVMVYNYLEVPKEITVKVDLHNLKGNEFEILEYSGCELIERKTVTKDTKTVKVPHYMVKRVSFYILPNMKTVLAQKTTKIQVTAVAEAPDHEPLKDGIRSKIKVEPIGVKIYDISSINYQLKRADNPKTDHKDYHLSDSSSEYPRIKLAIAGDFLSEKINMNTKFQMFPHNSLEQKTSLIKGNVEFLRYLKTKVKNPPTEGFSPYYQSLLIERTKNWNYANSTGFRAYFIEAIASAMELNALKMNKQIIENELDEIKSFQDSEGKFTKFGNMPESDSHPDTARYFETAYVLIPFLKFRALLSKDYSDVINKGMSYLKGSTNKLGLKRQALSMAAYAFALNNDTTEAKELLEAVEGDVIKIKTEKCYKLERSSASCDLRHTSYTANAYLTLNDVNKARPALAWLLQTYNINKYYSNTHAHAIATEVIAKFLSTLKINKTSEFTVNIRNDGGFNKNVLVNKNNSAEPIEYSVPDYSLMVNTSVSGIGYCSITTVVERTLSVDVIDPKFTLKITQHNTSISSEKIIRVCATYNPNESHDSRQTLLNVIYDVKIPSGYIYSSIVDYEKKPEIKMVEELEKKTRLQIYYNDYNKDKEYCVDVKAKRIFEVKNGKNAGVMVYDYENKKNVVAAFYTFADTCVN